MLTSALLLVLFSNGAIAADRYVPLPYPGAQFKNGPGPNFSYSASVQIADTATGDL